MNNIGKVIKEERISKKWTQEELASRIGVTQDSISLWEQGKRLPDTRYIILLCEVLQISSDYLLGLTEN